MTMYLFQELVSITQMIKDELDGDKNDDRSEAIPINVLLRCEKLLSDIQEVNLFLNYIL